MKVKGELVKELGGFRVGDLVTLKDPKTMSTKAPDHPLAGGKIATIDELIHDELSGKNFAMFKRQFWADLEHIRALRN